jgi:pilus assembly protein CpaF
MEKLNMSLRERLEQVRQKEITTPEVSAKPAPRDDSAYHDLRVRIHRKLLERVDLAALEAFPQERVRAEIKMIVERLTVEEGAAVNATERQKIVQDIQHEVLGLGPLEPLLAEPTVSDILVNTYKQVYVERFGKLQLTDVRFASNAHLLKIIDKIVSSVGRRIDESSPMVDARLSDGSRVNAIIPPLALDGPLLSIRRFAVVPLKTEDMLRLKTFTPDIAELLAGLVKAKVNILISGGTGSGKTTLLNILSSHIPAA